MNDLKITQGEWRSSVSKIGGASTVEANGVAIANLVGPNATADASVMASAPRLYDLLTDILSFLKDSKNKTKSRDSIAKWGAIERRARDVIASMPKAQ